MVIVVILGGVIVILILLIFLWCMSQKRKQFEREKSLTVSVDNMVMDRGRNQGNPNIPDDSENGVQINIQMHSEKTRQVSDEVSNYNKMRPMEPVRRSIVRISSTKSSKNGWKLKQRH